MGLCLIYLLHFCCLTYLFLFVWFQTFCTGKTQAPTSRCTNCRNRPCSCHCCCCCWSQSRKTILDRRIQGSFQGISPKSWGWFFNGLNCSRHGLQKAASCYTGHNSCFFSCWSEENIFIVRFACNLSWITITVMMWIPNMFGIKMVFRLWITWISKEMWILNFFVWCSDKC